MPLDLQHVRKRSAPFSVQLEGGTINGHFRPHMVPFEIIEVSSGMDTREDGEFIRKTLSAALDDWDLTDGGKPVPTTVESLKGISLIVLGAVLTSVMSEIRVPNGDGTLPAPSSTTD